MDDLSGPDWRIIVTKALSGIISPFALRGLLAGRYPLLHTEWRIGLRHHPPCAAKSVEIAGRKASRG